MIWSFSKLETWLNCPYAFYLRYLSGQSIPHQGNAFSDYGNFAHHLLEQWAIGEIDAENLPFEWDAGYDKAINHYFPPYMKGYREKAYLLGADYFSLFSGFDGYEIVSAEETFNVDIGPYPFTGIVDLVLRDGKTGEFMVVDHKTKGESTMKKDLDLFSRQLYIYAAHVKEKYGKSPDTLAFNMIKTSQLITQPFLPEKMEETIQWATDIIDEISMATDFAEKPTPHFCRYICDVRSGCPHVPIYTQS